MKKTQTTNQIAVREIARRHRVNVRNGYIYNSDGQIIGSNYSEPRISVRVNTPAGPKKYAVRSAKVVAFVQYGAKALNPNIEVRHIDGDKFNNAGKNLVLVRRRRGELTATQIRRVRNLVQRGRSTNEIVGRTGLSRHQVRRISNGAYATIQ